MADKTKKFAIVTDGALLIKRIVAAKGKVQALHDELHVLVVSGFFHAAKHGDTRPLNSLFNDVLSSFPNMQTSVRNYMGMIFRKDEKYKCMEYKTGTGFSMLPDVAEQKEHFAKLCETNLINPDGKEFQSFYGTDNVVTTRILEIDNSKILSQLRALAKRAKGEGSTDTTEVHSTVSTNVRKKLDEMVTFLESVAENEDKKPANDSKKAA